MNTHVTTALPTPEEQDAFFRDLPPLGPSRSSRVRRSLSDQPLATADTGLKDDAPGVVSKDQPVVIAFADNVKPEDRAAVMRSVEFSERFANKQFDINVDPIGWHKHYAKLMGYCGWAISTGQEYGEYTTSDKSLTMDAVVLELLSLVAGPNAAVVVDVMKLALDTLQGNTSMMQLFEGKSKKGNSASFRLMPCVVSKTGIPLTYFLAVHVEFTQTSGGVLFWKWKASSLRIRRVAKSVEFFDESHERVKAKILEKLQADSENLFDSL